MLVSIDRVCLQPLLSCKKVQLQTNYTKNETHLAAAKKYKHCRYIRLQNRNDIGNVVLGQLRGQPH